MQTIAAFKHPGIRAIPLSEDVSRWANAFLAPPVIGFTPGNGVFRL
ncbi:hypothetical protein [Microvirga sp. P5_D2]